MFSIEVKVLALLCWSQKRLMKIFSFILKIPEDKKTALLLVNGVRIHGL